MTIPKTRPCQYCGQALRPTAKFCSRCGQENPLPPETLPKIDFCGICGTKRKPGARFCPQCGTPFETPEPIERAHSYKPNDPHSEKSVLDPAEVFPPDSIIIDVPPGENPILKVLPPEVMPLEVVPLAQILEEEANASKRDPQRVPAKDSADISKSISKTDSERASKRAPDKVPGKALKDPSTEPENGSSGSTPTQISASGKASVSAAVSSSNGSPAPARRKPSIKSEKASAADRSTAVQETVPVKGKDRDRSAGARRPSAYDKSLEPVKRSEGKKPGGKFIPVTALVLVLALGAYLLRDVWGGDPVAPRDPSVSTPSVTSPAAIGDFEHLAAEQWVSGSKALAMEPVSGLRLRASENALDRDRDFKVDALDPKAVWDLFPEDEPFVPVYGFDMDSGMTQEEIFPGTLEVAFDLVTLGVPETLWEDVLILRIDDNGDRTLIDGDLADGDIVIETRKNCIFVLGFALSTEFVVTVTGLVTIGPTSIKLYNDYYRKYNYLGDDYSVDRFGKYMIYWPTSLVSPDADAVRKTYEAIAQRVKAHGADFNDLQYGDPAMILSRMESLKKDADYQDLIRAVNDPLWKKMYYWPPRVTLAIEALERGDEYLRDHRKFRMPTGDTDILMLHDWPSDYGQTLAMCDGNFGQKAFVAVNLSDATLRGALDETVLVNGKATTYTATEDLQPKIDELNITLVHELFHVVQEEYVSLRSDDYLWFWEATALTLENEANAFYTAKGWNQNEDHSVDRDVWESLRLPMDLTTGDETVRQSHGYTLSRFVEYLRDDASFNQNPGEAYLSAVLEDFRRFRSSPLSAIHEAGQASIADLSARFLAFARDRAETMVGMIKPKAEAAAPAALVTDVAQTLDAAHPYYEWVWENRPLSSEMRIFSLKNIPPAQLKTAQIVLIPDLGVKASDLGLHHQVRTDTGWGTVKDEIASYRTEGLTDFVLQRIDATTATSWFGSGFTLRVLLMLQPQAPTADLTGDELKVKFPRSELANDRRVSHLLLLTLPGEEQPVQIQVPLDQQEIRIDLSDGSDKASRLKATASFQVSHRELVHFTSLNKLVAGPESPRVTVSRSSDINWEGTWSDNYITDSSYVGMPYEDEAYIRQKNEEAKGKVSVQSACIITKTSEPGFAYAVSTTYSNVDSFLGFKQASQRHYLAQTTDETGVLALYYTEEGKALTGALSAVSGYLIYNGDGTITLRSITFQSDTRYKRE